MTLFRIDRTRGADALRRLVGPKITPVITSDRFSTYKVVPVRQVCWAHLRRDFQAMIDRAAGGQEVGSKLLALSGRVFDWWRRLGSGAIRRSTLRGYVGWLRPVVRLNLEAGRRWPVPSGRRRCAGNSWRSRGRSGRFARVEGVGPDNNPAERALRHGVIWRKTSGGTDGERGSRFVGQVLSVGGDVVSSGDSGRAELT